MKQGSLVTRLDFLFQNKVLDAFVGECKSAVEQGVDLKQIGIEHGLKYDLKVQFEEMSRVMETTKELLAISKMPNEGWKSLPIDDRCFLAIRTNHTLIQIKTRGTIDCNLVNVLYLAYLIKLYKHCLPFCKEAHDIKEPTCLQKVGFVRLSIPIPFIKDRCTFLRGIGIDRLKTNGTVCIFAEGINSNKEYLEHHKIEIGDKMKGKELLDLKHFALEVTRVSQNKINYSGYCLVDHHIPLIPEIFISLVAKQLAKYLFTHLMKQLKNFQGSIWDKQRKENYEENRYFYDWIQSKKEDLAKLNHCTETHNDI